MVVLVVEDETLVRMFMADFLDEAGFKVFEAVNADEALTVLQARPDVQVVITDIEMPASAMNGLKLAQTFQERWPGVGVAISSGRERPVLTTCRRRWRSWPSPTCLTPSSTSSDRWPRRR